MTSSLSGFVLTDLSNIPFQNSQKKIHYQRLYADEANIWLGQRPPMDVLKAAIKLPNPKKSPGLNSLNFKIIKFTGN